jgi:hypothetical protein
LKLKSAFRRDIRQVSKISKNEGADEGNYTISYIFDSISYILNPIFYLLILYTSVKLVSLVKSV